MKKQEKQFENIKLHYDASKTFLITTMSLLIASIIGVRATNIVFVDMALAVLMLVLCIALISFFIKFCREFKKLNEITSNSPKKNFVNSRLRGVPKHIDNFTIQYAVGFWSGINAGTTVIFVGLAVNYIISKMYSKAITAFIIFILLSIILYSSGMSNTKILDIIVMKNGKKTK